MDTSDERLSSLHRPDGLPERVVGKPSAYLNLGSFGIFQLPPLATLRVRAVFFGISAAALGTARFARPFQLPRPLFTMITSMAEGGVPGERFSCFRRLVVACLHASRAPREPSQGLLVRREDGWYPGHVEAWRRDGTDWPAFVRYSTGTGMQHLEWVSAERVRESTPLGVVLAHSAFSRP